MKFFLYVLLLFSTEVTYSSVYSPNNSQNQVALKFFEAGKKSYDKGEYKEATEYFLKARKACKKFIVTDIKIKQTCSYEPIFSNDIIYLHSNFYLGLINLDLGDYDKAVINFSKAIGTINDKEDNEIYITKSNIYTNPSWFIYKGLALIGKGNVKQAILSFEDAILFSSFFIDYFWPKIDGEDFASRKMTPDWCLEIAVIGFCNTAVAYYTDHFGERDTDLYNGIIACDTAIDLSEGKLDSDFTADLRRENWREYWDHNYKLKPFCLKNNGNPTLYSNRGLLYFFYDDLERALKYFNKAIELDPSNPSFYLYRSIVHFCLNRSKDCLSDLNLAIDLNPEDPDMRTNRAMFHFLYGNEYLAESDIDIALEIEKKELNNKFALGWNSYVTKNYTDSINFFSDVLDKDSKAYYFRGNVFYALKNYEMAINDFNKMLESNPLDIDSLNDRALAYLGQSNYEKAHDDLEQALRISNNNAKLHNSLGLTYLSQDNAEKAAESFQRASEIEESNPIFHLNKGIAFMKLLRFEEAIDAFHRAIEKGYHELKIYRYLGLCNYYLERFNNAIESYLKIVKNNEADESLYNDLGLAYFANSNHDKSLVSLNKAIEMNSHYSEAYKSRGIVKLSLNRVNEGINDLLKSVELTESNTLPLKNKEKTLPAFFIRKFNKSHQPKRPMFEGKHDSPHSIDENSEVDVYQFSKGMISGAFSGGANTLASLGELGKNIIFHPIATSKTIIIGVKELFKLIDEGEWEEISETLTPEIKEFYLKKNTLSDFKKGEIIGKCLSNYGLTFFSCGLLPAKIAKSLVKLNRIDNNTRTLTNLKKVTENKLLDVHPDTPVLPANSWVMPKKGGAIIGERYYTEHALARMAPKKNPYVRAILEQRQIDNARRNGIEPASEAFGEWVKQKGTPFRIDPRNIPPSVVEAEIANPGTTGISVILNESGSVVTICP